ncbi:MAG TPA: nicotinate phosphoribosyltransferase [Vicinamibacterales bacterium]|nr:nicotinate phosphoribosyltransferase [Vicinamibacterales bacterium]
MIPRQWPAPINAALFTDLYELTMVQAFVEEGFNGEAVFDVFVRRLPQRRNYLVACGVGEVLAFLESVRFDAASLEYLASLRMFSARFLDYLERFRFSGDVAAIPEGTPVFAFEPLLEIAAPLPEAQLIETLVLNQIGLQTMLASKASRVVTAAAGRGIVDFGLRRTQGIDAGMKAARAFYIAGVAATSNVAGGHVYGIPVAGTMGHSYIQAHADEREAFRRFASRYPGTTLLVDTYDTLDGVARVIDLAREQGSSFSVQAIRLDSGDLGDLAVRARAMLDDAGLTSVRIVASGNLDEDSVAALVARGAPIDVFGVGTEMAVSADAPRLDIVYKLVSYDGLDRVKLSPGKRVLPGRKQVFRIEEDGLPVRDVVGAATEHIAGRPLLVDVMKNGARLETSRETLDVMRSRAAAQIAALPDRLRTLEPADQPYTIDYSRELEERYDRAARTRHAAE